MGYGGGDLLLTGAAWPTVRSLPRPVCAGCGRWPGWLAALVSDESALEAAWPPDHRPDSRPYGGTRRCAIQIDVLYLSPFMAIWLSKLLSRFSLWFLALYKLIYSRLNRYIRLQSLWHYKLFQQQKETFTHHISSPTDAIPNLSHMLGQNLSFHEMKSSSMLTHIRQNLFRVFTNPVDFHHHHHHHYSACTMSVRSSACYQQSPQRLIQGQLYSVLEGKIVQR